jgi:hypothetical protein
MSMMELANFPLRDQLAPVAGRVVQNSRMDCVWESYAACLEEQTGLRVSGDEVLDFIKGPTYQGAGNAAWIDGRVAEHFGARVIRFPGGAGKESQPRLMVAIRDYLAQGLPCIVTIPSAWNSQPSVAGYTPASPRFSTHAVAAYGIDRDLAPSGAARLMNPWHGVRQDVSVAWLQRRLCYGSIWPVQAISQWRAIAAMPGWEDDGKQLRKRGSSVVLVKGFRKYALLHPELFSGVFADQEPLKNEYPFGNGTEQPLTYVKFVWTPASGVRLEPNQLAA